MQSYKALANKSHTATFFITELDGFFQSYQLSHIAENKTSTSFSSYERDLIIDCSVYSIAICVTSM